MFVSWERTDIVSGIFFSRRVCLMGENRQSIWCVCFVPCLSYLSGTDIVSGVFVLCRVCRVGENRHSIWCGFFFLFFFFMFYSSFCATYSNIVIVLIIN